MYHQGDGLLASFANKPRENPPIRSLVDFLDKGSRKNADFVVLFAFTLQPISSGSRQARETGESMNAGVGSQLAEPK